MSPTRRQILGTLAAGSLGVLGSQGTAAWFRDVERTEGRLVAGTLDLRVEAWTLSPADGFEFDPADPDRTADGNRLTLPLEITADAEPRRTLLRFSLPEAAPSVNNPATLWLRTGCPPATTLAEFLGVRVSYADADGTPGERIVEGPLRRVAGRFRDGERLDGDGNPSNGIDCLREEAFVVFEYGLEGYVGAETVSVPIEAVAVQCRARDPDRNPFPTGTPAACVPGYACDCCWIVGKIETDDQLVAGETYRFDEGLAGYALRVTAVEGATGVAFELVSTDGRPVYPLCRVAVKGGPDEIAYERRDGEFGFSTDVLEGSDAGLVYAPENPNADGRFAMSYVLVSVCTPTLTDGACPGDAASGGAGGPTPAPPEPGKGLQERAGPPTGGGGS